MQTTEEQSTDLILDTPEFAAFFAADLPITRREFTIAGKPAWIDLRPLDSEASETYRTVGLELRIAPGETIPEITKTDLAARNTYLVSHCVVGYHLWTQARLKDGTARDWQQVCSPEDFVNLRPEQRERRVAEAFKCNPQAWEWLVLQCAQINGFTEGAAKN